MDAQGLIAAAFRAREDAYAPYSGFWVGAALESADGRIFTGCNIENAAYPVSNCAERTALFKAVSEGAREFLHIAVVGGKRGEPVSGLCAPCGVCRQALAEFCDADTFKIYFAAEDGRCEEFLLRDLLPQAFTPKNLS